MVLPEHTAAKVSNLNHTLIRIITPYWGNAFLVARESPPARGLGKVAQVRGGRSLNPMRMAQMVSSDPVWKVWLWATKLSNPTEDADIWEVCIASHTGKVSRTDLHIHSVD